MSESSTQEIPGRIQRALGWVNSATRAILITIALLIALGAALAPMVYLLRRVGVG